MNVEQGKIREYGSERPDSATEKTKEKLLSLADKNPDPAFKDALKSLCARLDALPNTSERESVSREVELVILQAERDNQKIGVDFYKTVDLLLSGAIG